MATEFTMPKLGLTMEEGTILQWLVPDGGDVVAGMAVLVVETDKVETEVECPAVGRLVQTGSVGTAYRCGTAIGWILGPGESAPAGAAPAEPSVVSVASPGTPAAAAAAPGTAHVGPEPTLAGSVGSSARTPGASPRSWASTSTAWPEPGRTAGSCPRTSSPRRLQA